MTARAGVFELVAPLRSGGMAQVWAAVHPPSGERVALKVLSGADPVLAEALEREICAVAGLDHPHVVWVHDHGTVDAGLGRALGARPGSPWLAMELCDGGTLAERGRGLPFADQRKVLLDLLDALAHAHARGVLHRDLKPGNVLFREVTGRLPVTKLGDFGLVHTLEGWAAEGTSPGTPVHGGTPAYMAPEQFERDPADQGPWTDLYALGCVAWWLATGRTPFRARSGIEYRTAHAARPLPRLRASGSVPRGYEAWLRALLAKEPHARFRRAADAAAALARLGDVPRERRTAARAASTAETVRLSDDPTERLPRTGPTLIATAPTAIWLPDTAPRIARRGGPEVGERPPFPHDWRVPALLGRASHLLGAGLRIFGLRSLPVVGRFDERDALWRALVEAGDGQARAVVLEGPPGIGKSRLAAWLLERAHEVGAAETFRAAHGATPGPQDGLRGLVARAFRVGGRTEDEARRRIAAVLGDDGPARDLALIATGGEVPAARRIGRVADAVRRLAGRRIATVWLDDVQWGHDALALADRLLADGGPVLVVLTVRRDALGERELEEEALRALASRPGASRLAVGPLGRRHRAELVRTLLGLDPRLAVAVDDRSGGNPLFAVQIVTDRVERGVLVPGPQGFVLAPGERDAVPASLAQVWADRLAPVVAGRAGDREALELAACLGQTVDASEWAEACGEAGLEAPRGLVLRLVARRLVELDPGSVGQRWTFVHGLLREAILADAGDRLARWHAACAAMLARRDAPDRRGLHLLEAGRPAEALPQLRAAAHRAEQVGEYGRQLWLYALVARALDTTTGPDDPQRAHNRLGEAWALRGAGRVAEARAALDEVLAWADAHGRGRVRATALDQLSILLGETGDVDAADRAAAEALRIAEEAGDRGLEATVLGRVAMVRGRRGDLDGAEAAALRVLEIAADDSSARSTAWFCLTTAAMHRKDQPLAWRRGLEGRAVAERTGNAMVVADFDRQLADVAQARGDLAEAERRLAACRTTYEASESGMLALVLVMEGWIRAQREDLAGAEASFRLALVTAEQAGRPAWAQRASLSWLAVSAKRADWETYDRLLDRFVHRKDRELYGWFWEVLLDAGDTARAAGEPERARLAWEQARAILATMGVDPEPAERRLRELGELSSRSDRPRRSRPSGRPAPS